jgi:hypothetical protein
MPTTDPSTTCIRGHKTICIPCSQEQYEPIVDNPEQFRRVAGSTDPSHARTLPAGDQVLTELRQGGGGIGG